MLKKWPILVMTLAMAGVANAAYSGTPTAKESFTTGTVDGKNCYMIGTAEDLYGFAAIVNGGESDACGVLTADITVNTGVLASTGELNTSPEGGFISWNPIGFEVSFNGFFDGQGHTISGLYFNDDGLSNIGLFGSVNGGVNGENEIEATEATIKNVGIKDSYFRAGYFVGGVVGYVFGYGSLDIENVFNAAYVEAISEEEEVFGLAGGLVGYVENSDGQILVLNITNAYNVGSIKGKDEYLVGGLVGKVNVDKYEVVNKSVVYVNIKNAFNYGKVNGGTIVPSMVFNNDDLHFDIQNSYYLAEESAGMGKSGKSAEEFANGTVYAALHSAEDGSVWHQYKNDAYPTFVEKTGEDPIATHSVTLHYSATESETIYFAEGAATLLPTADENGNIIVGWYDNSDFTGTKYSEIPATATSDLQLYPKAMELDGDGFYKIATADDLYAFASAVNNNSTFATAKAKLIADIVVNQNVLGTNNANVNADGSYNNAQAASSFTPWTPIGTSSNAFKGVFKGQGHTISGLYFNNSETNNVGLFGYTSGAVTIDGVGVVDSYFCGKDYVGSLVGQAVSSGANELTVTKSYNKGAVTGNSNVGGLVGKNGNVKFSYNTGSVTGTSNVGGLVGSNANNNGQNGFEINGSYNVGLVKKGTDVGNAVLGEGCPTNGQISAVKNVYYLAGSGDECSGAFSMTSYEFADGLVAITLHNDKTTLGADIWGQVVGTDKTPVLTGEIKFPITLDNSDNCYEISSAEDLNVFAAIVNSGFKSDACGKLTEDFVVNENVLANVNSDGTLKDGVNFTPWTPIGFGTNSFNESISFKGTFKGQGHTISGLYFNDAGAENVGLFGDVSGTVSIDGVGLVDSYIMASGWVGGLVGFASGSLTINNSYNASSVTSSYAFGGLVGAAGKGSSLAISNSYNVGSLNGGEWGGGLVGYANALVVSNSYNAGSIYISVNDAYVGGITSSVDVASSVTNSFNYGSISYPTGNSVNKDDLVADGADGGEGEVKVTKSFTIGESRFDGDGSTKMTSDKFKDGTVYAALHSDEDGDVWFQSPGDKYPTLSQEKNGPAVHVVTLNYPKEGSSSEYDSETISYVEGFDKSFPTMDKNGTPILGWYSLENPSSLMTEIPTSTTDDVMTLFPKMYEPAADGCYEIATANQLYLFAAVVNNGKATACARLTANIVVNQNVLGENNANVNATTGEYIGTTTDFREWTPIGFGKDNENIVSFNGLFDGQGHSISGLYFNKADAQYVGLFGTLSTATIKNVGVEDSYFKGSDCIGGILGFVDVDASVNIENVYNAAVVVGRDRAGGIICGDFGNKSHVTNAYNVGMVFAESYAGGIVGYNYSDEKTTIHNSFNYGTVSAGTGTAGALVGAVAANADAAGFSVTNSFYLGDAANGGYGEYKSASDFENGTVLAALQSNADGYMWKQGGKYPVFDTFEPATDGCYEIANRNQLYWFAAIVNDGKANACARLTANIVVNQNVLGENNANVNATTGEYIGSNSASFSKWTPIGNNSNPFTGSFDGQGYSISGLYFNGENVYDVGLFGKVQGDKDGASIENVGVEDSYFGDKGTTGDHVGGIVGSITQGGTVNVTNVSSAAVVVGYDYVGGIVGYVLGTEGDLNLDITNAYNVGMVKGHGYVGGLVGEVNDDRSNHNITINNSYNYGEISYEITNGGTPLIGSVKNNGSVAKIEVNNSYYLGTETAGGYGTNKSAEEFADGTVLVALRSGDGGNVWVQNPNDKYPTIDINATNAKTVVLTWTSAADSTTLATAGYTDGAVVVVKDGKKFYADGNVYEGILTAEQVEAIGTNKLYPISGVQLETVSGKLVATLDGDSKDALLISQSFEVDTVIYKRQMTESKSMTVMLPFSISLSSTNGYNGNRFYNFKEMVEDKESAYEVMMKVSAVKDELAANTPYILIPSQRQTQIKFVQDGKIALEKTTTINSVERNGWTMHGVYEYKKWNENSELGAVFGFAAQARDGFHVGDFVEVGGESDIYPMRAYLKHEVPQGVLGRNGRTYFGNASGMLGKVRVEIVDDEEETTTVVRRNMFVPTVVKANRWFDSKGRALGQKPTAKGTYYYNGQRVIIK